MREKTCCFTGHRELTKQDYKRIGLILEQTIVDLIARGVIFYGAGGALGFDTIAAQTILKLKKKYPHIKLILVLPCKTQAKQWSFTDKEEYERIKAKADKVVYVTQEYTDSCLFKRNRHLVDHSSIFVCYLTKDTGGTDYTVSYARMMGLEVINIAG